MSNWSEEMKSICKKAKWAYSPPIPKTKPRVMAKGRSGKVKIYTREEKLLYLLKNFPAKMITL